MAPARLDSIHPEEAQQLVTSVWEVLVYALNIFQYMVLAGAVAY